MRTEKLKRRQEGFHRRARNAVPMRTVLLVIVLLLLAGERVLAGGGSRPARRFPVGIVQDFVWTKDADIDPLIKLAKESGATHVRICIRWNVVEPRKGEWNFDRVDMVVRKLRAAKLDIFAILGGVPGWANGTEGKKVEGWADTYPPDSDEDWANYVRIVIKRYRKDIKLWEIWNEPNGVDFFRPLPDARRYVELLKAAYRACKEADPKCKVLLGSMQMNGVIPNPWSPVKTPNFLQAIYDHGGKPYFDLLNIHPYVLPSEGAKHMAELIQGTIEVAKRNGDGKKPIWVTEIGCGINANDTAEAQAKLLADSFDALASIPQIGGAFWFCLADFEKDLVGPEASMGIVTRNLVKKPSFFAFQKAAEKYRNG